MSEDEEHEWLHWHFRLVSGIVLCGIVLSMAIEIVVHAIAPDHCGHGHSHGSQDNIHGGHGHSHGVQQCNHSHSDGMPTEKIHSHGLPNTTFYDQDQDQFHSHGHIADVESPEQTNDAELSCWSKFRSSLAQKLQDLKHWAARVPQDLKRWFRELRWQDFKNWFYEFKDVRTSVWLFTLAATIHHVSDGLLIAISGTWAIFGGIAAHEVPHSLGALAYFLQEGCRKSHAVFLLFVSGIGYFIGASVTFIFQSHKDDIEYYGRFFVVGVFLYVLLFLLLPELTHFSGRRQALIRSICFIATLVLVSFFIIKYHSHGPDECNHGHSHGRTSCHGHHHEGCGGHGHGGNGGGGQGPEGNGGGGLKKNGGCGHNHGGCGHNHGHDHGHGGNDNDQNGNDEGEQWCLPCGADQTGALGNGCGGQDHGHGGNDNDQNGNDEDKQLECLPCGADQTQNYRGACSCIGKRRGVNPSPRAGI